MRIISNLKYTYPVRDISMSVKPITGLSIHDYCTTQLNNCNLLKPHEARKSRNNVQTKKVIIITAEWMAHISNIIKYQNGEGNMHHILAMISGTSRYEN